MVITIRAINFKSPIFDNKIGKVTAKLENDCRILKCDRKIRKLTTKFERLLQNPKADCNFQEIADINRNMPESFTELQSNFTENR